VTREIKNCACRRGSLIIKVFGVEMYNSGKIADRKRGTGRWAAW